MSPEEGLIPRGNRRRAFVRRLATPRVPGDIARNFRAVDAQRLASIEDSLKKSYFLAERFPADYLETDEGRADLSDHLVERLVRARTVVIPWLSSASQLSGARLLEIGSGTGASTLAFAEQGAHVTALDVDRASLSVAEHRCMTYGFTNITYVVSNASSLTELFDDGVFDIVLFYASLEHMTRDERERAITASWRVLRPGGLWVIVESPNTLWYYDNHTSLLPFFHWLSDDVAAEYMRFSPRERMRERFRVRDERTIVRLARSGRGVSYHELQLSLEEFTQLQVVSSLASYQRRRNLVMFGYWLLRERRFESMLQRAAPDIARAFFHPYLDIIIRKPDTSSSQPSRSG